jgi:hypothetical protein
MQLDRRWVRDMRHGATASWIAARATAAMSVPRVLSACVVRTDAVPRNEAAL